MARKRFTSMIGAKEIELGERESALMTDAGCASEQPHGAKIVVLSSVAYALFLSLNSFALWGFTSLTRSMLGDSAQVWTWSYLGSNVAFFFIMAAIGGAREYQGKHVALHELFALSALFVAVGLAFLVGLLQGVSADFVLLSGIFMGAGTTLLFACWELQFCLLGIARTRQVLAIGSALSLASIIGYELVDPSGYLFLLIVYALFAFGSLYIVQHVCLPEEGNGVFSDCAAVSSLSLFSSRGIVRLISPMLCVCMVGVVATVEGGLLQTSSGAFLEQAAIVYGESLVAAILMAIIWFVFKRDIGVTMAYAIFFPILATLLLAPMMGETACRVASFVAGLAFVMFSMLVAENSLRMASSSKAPLLFVYGMMAGALYLSQLLGVWLGNVVDAAGLSQDAASLMSVMLVLWGCSIVMIFAFRANRSEKTPLATEEPLVENKPQVRVDPLALGASLIAQENSLSERQAQVLDLLAHGNAVPMISQQLNLSENTVRTHVKRIYTVLDIHSRADLVKLVNERADQEQSDVVSQDRER
jgi:DNA-binding CsgD family transcriptional regulator